MPLVPASITGLGLLAPCLLGLSLLASWQVRPALRGLASLLAAAFANFVGFARVLSRIAFQPY